jgi:predicted AAA+ superfamily ATPase
MEDKVSKSKVFEWLMVMQIKAEFFWRDPYKNEVDIVLANKKPIPIEIKYGKIETKKILTFMKKFNVSNGYIISYDKEEKQKINEKSISIIPAFKFLLNENK